jgi:hypothetical protein
MSHRSRRAGTFGLALLLVGLGAAPARATTPLSLQLPARHHLLTEQLSLAGSPGDAAAPFMNPVLGEGLAGLGAGLITVPLMMLAGVSMQNDSPNLVVAALPPLLLFIAVPAVGVTFSEWAVGHALGAQVRVQPSVYIALGVQVLAYLFGTLAGVNPKNFAGMAVFSVVDALVLSGVVLGTMNLQLALATPPKTASTDVILPPTGAVAARTAHSDAFTSGSGVSLFAGAF